MSVLNKIRAALADTKTLEPVFTDKWGAVLSQKQIDDQVSRLSFLIEAIGRCSLF